MATGRGPRRPRRGRWLLRLLTTAVLGTLLGAAVITAWGLHDRVGAGDLIVVPGNTVAADGTPSPRLAARLDAAVRLYTAGRAPAILVSGAVGVEGYDESSAMADYLVAHGVPSGAVIRDGAGVDTAATAAHTAQVLARRGGQRAVIATQYFHVARTEILLRRAGVEVTGSAHARHVELRDAYSLLRELPACALALVGLDR